MTKSEIYQKAIIKWGVDSQIDMLIEECSELITALQHFKRGRNSNVAEEIADLEIVLGQIKPLFNTQKDVDEWARIKLERLEKRVSN